MTKKLVEPVFVQNQEQFDIIKNNTRIKYFCQKCGRECEVKVRADVRWRNRRLLCNRCNQIVSNREKYGTDFPNQNQDVINKRHETNIKKYGVKSVCQTNEFKEKRRQSLIKHYGTSNLHEIPEIMKKVEETNLKNLGVRNPFESKEIQKKCEKSNLNNNGYIRPTRPPKYKFNDITFDSSWELAFYVYHYKNGNDIKREPYTINYTFNGKTHKYYPDFEVNGQLYEIKGDQFIKNGKMCNIYEDEINELAEAKRKCAVEHNVKFIFKNEIKPYLDWIKANFGSTFLAEHKLIFV